jgi:glyoxylase-like metal-dependent hydrolase (beta-lactamase superfamily II)
MKPTRTFVLLAVLIITVPLVLCATMMVSSHTIFAAAAETLHLDVFIGDADSWGVTSTLIYGKSEAILADSQLRTNQAKKLADEVAARLKAIIITHPDEDHYFGTAVLHERFPDTPIYMTAAALEQFNRTSSKYLAYFKKKAPSEAPRQLADFGSAADYDLHRGW